MNEHGNLLLRAYIQTVFILFIWGTPRHLAEGVSSDKPNSASTGSNYSHHKDIQFKAQFTSYSVQRATKETAYIPNRSLTGTAQSNHAGLRKPLNVSSFKVRKSRDSDSVSPVPLSTLANGIQDSPSSESDQVQQKYYRLVSRRVMPMAGGRAAAQNVNVIVGVLLPFSANKPFDVRKVAPAFEIAVEKVATSMGPWTFHSLTVLYRDSQCNIADSMNQAIQLYERQKTSAFFGPVCDYAIAPVARQARYWNTPMITAGATAYDFYWLKTTTFSTLTRIGPANFQGCSEFLQDVARRYQWEKGIILYDSHGQDDNMEGFCHLLVDYLHSHFKGIVPKINVDHYKLDDGVYPTTEGVFRNKVKTEYSDAYAAAAHNTSSISHANDTRSYQKNTISTIINLYNSEANITVDTLSL